MKSHRYVVPHPANNRSKAPPEDVTLQMRIVTQEAEAYLLRIPATRLAKVPELQFLLADKLLSEKMIQELLGVSLEVARLYSSLPWMMDDSNFERVGKNFGAVVERALAGIPTSDDWEVLKKFVFQVRTSGTGASFLGQANVGPKRKRGGEEEERPTKMLKREPVPDFLSDLAEELSLRRDYSVSTDDIKTLRKAIKETKVAMEEGSEGQIVMKRSELQMYLDELEGSLSALGQANFHDANLGAVLAILRYSGTHYHLWAVQHAFRRFWETYTVALKRAEKAAESSIEERAELDKNLRLVEELASETERARLKGKLSELERLIEAPERLQSEWRWVAAAPLGKVLDRGWNRERSLESMEKYTETGEGLFLRLHDLHVILVAALDAGEGERLRSFGPSPLGALGEHYGTVDGHNVVGDMDMGREHVFLPRPVEKLAVAFPEWEVDLALKVTGDWELLADALRQSHGLRYLKFLTVAAAACASRYRDLHDFAKDFPDGSLELRRVSLGELEEQDFHGHRALLAKDSRKMFEEVDPMAVDAKVSGLYEEFVSAMGRRTGILGREVSRWFPKEWYAETLGAHPKGSSNSSNVATVSTDVLTHWVVPYFWSQTVRSGGRLHPVEHFGSLRWEKKKVLTVPLQGIHMLFRSSQLIPFKSVVVVMEPEKTRGQCLFPDYITSLLLNCHDLHSYWVWDSDKGLSYVIPKLENLYELKAHSSAYYHLAQFLYPNFKLRSVMFSSHWQHPGFTNVQNFGRLEKLVLPSTCHLMFAKTFQKPNQSLKFLRINHVGFFDDKYIEGLTSLEYLELTGSKTLSGNGLKSLVELRKADLSLGQDLKIENLGRLGKLTFLNVSNTNVKCSELKGLVSLKILHVKHFMYDEKPTFQLHGLFVKTMNIDDKLPWKGSRDPPLRGFEDLRILLVETSRELSVLEYFLGLMTNLEKFYILADHAHSMFKVLKNLKLLHVAEGIDDLDDSGFIGMPNLEVLIAEDSNLKGSDLYHCKKLRKLCISMSKYFEDSALQGMEYNLMELYADETNLTGSTLGVLQNLRVLHVSRCENLKDFPLANMIKLVELYANETDLTGSDFRSNSLRILHISKCEEFMDSSLVGMPNLVELRANETNLTGSTLGVLQNLRVLHVSRCKNLKNFALGALDLREFRANQTELTEKNFESNLKNLKNLEILELLGCKRIYDLPFANLKSLKALSIHETVFDPLNFTLMTYLELLENLKLLYVSFDNDRKVPSFCIGRKRIKFVAYCTPVFIIQRIWPEHQQSHLESVPTDKFRHEKIYILGDMVQTNWKDKHLQRMDLEEMMLENWSRPTFVLFQSSTCFQDDFESK